MKATKNKTFDYLIDTQKEHNIIDFSKPIMISCESLAPFTERNIISEDGRILHIDLMYFNSVSRNSNLYPREDTVRSFNESTWIQENLRNRTLFGELEHPESEASLERFMRVEPTRYAWNIMSIEDKGDHYEGDVGLCAPLGTSIVLPNMKDFGSNYAASCRISTPNYIVKDMNGRKVYVKKYKQFPITVDCVSTPGIPQCRLIKDGEYVPEKQNVQTGVRTNESASPLFIAEFTKPEESIREMLKSKESGRILSDIYGIDFDKTNIVLTKDKKIKLSMESGISATIPFNSYILADVLKSTK